MGNRSGQLLSGRSLQRTRHCQPATCRQVSHSQTCVGTKHACCRHCPILVACSTGLHTIRRQVGVLPVLLLQGPYSNFEFLPAPNFESGYYVSTVEHWYQLVMTVLGNCCTAVTLSCYTDSSMSIIFVTMVILQQGTVTYVASCSRLVATLNMTSTKQSSDNAFTSHWNVAHDDYLKSRHYRNTGTVRNL